MSEAFPATKGPRQRCCVSPTLFKLYAFKALYQWKRKYRGMEINLDDDTCFYTLQFSDDQVVCAGNRDDLEYIYKVGSNNKHFEKN